MAVPTEAFNDEMWETLPRIQFTQVVPWDLSQSGKQLLPYLLSPLSVLDDILYGKEEELINGSVKIVDFGNAFGKLDNRRVSNVPDIVIAPEIRFFKLSSEKVDHDWDLRSDIWSMACTIYEICFGQRLFHRMSGVDGIFREMIALAGPLPQRWKPYVNSNLGEETNDYKIADVDSNWEVRRQRYMEIHGTQFDNEHALEKDTSQLIAMLQEINTRVRFAAASMA